MAKTKKGYLFGPNTVFRNPTVGRLRIKRVGDQVENFIREEKGDYQLIIGTDSHARTAGGKKGLTLVTALVIHRRGKGGRYFWTRVEIPRYFSLKEKIYQETLASLEMANRFLPLLKNHLNGDFQLLEIHIDAGGGGSTKEIIKELVGMVVGNGFTAKTKPDAYGASSVADRYA